MGLHSKQDCRLRLKLKLSWVTFGKKQVKERVMRWLQLTMLGKKKTRSKALNLKLVEMCLVAVVAMTITYILLPTMQ